MRPMRLPVVLFLLFASCNSVAPWRPRYSTGPSAVGNLGVILAGQATFHKTDFYGKGELGYANTRDGGGYSDLYQVPSGGSATRPLRIDRALATIASGAPFLDDDHIS